MKIFLTGGTGFIGKALSKNLTNQGHHVTILSRKNIKNSNQKIDFITDLDDKDFNYDIVINLCGEPISQRWTSAKKEQIYHSRIDLTNKISEKIINSKSAPKLFISASAIGYYGTSLDKIFNENSQVKAQNLFSQKICKDWESSARKAEGKTKLSIIRLAVVLGKGGGIIQKLSAPFKLGLGGKIGAGSQPFSWIALEDVIGAINHIIKNNLSGTFNLSAPAASNNLKFSKAFAKSLKRPSFFAMPAFIMRLIYGEMADELLLSGQKVYPKNLLESGFQFKFNELKEALDAAIKNHLHK